MGFRETCVVGKADPKPDRELEAGFEVEEGHGAVLVLFSCYPLRGKAETIAVEAHRPFKVIHADCQHGNARLHVAPPAASDIPTFGSGRSCGVQITCFTSSLPPIRSVRNDVDRAKTFTLSNRRSDLPRSFNC